MKKRTKKQLLILWGAGAVAVLLVAGATAALLVHNQEHAAFASALAHVNNNLRDNLKPNATLSALSADMSDDMTQVSSWYTSETVPAYQERQALLGKLKLSFTKMISQYEEYCDKSENDEILAEIRATSGSIRFLKEQKKIIADLEKLVGTDVTKGCDDEIATAGVLLYYLEAIEAASHQIEIYDSQYTNTIAIEALGSLNRRYKTQEDVEYIEQIRNFIGKEKFGRYFDANAKLYTALYKYAHEEDESKFTSGFENINQLQSDVDRETVLFSMYLSSALDKGSDKALERSLAVHQLLQSGAESTAKDTHFNASVTTTYVLISAIQDYSISRGTLPDAKSAEGLAEDDLRLRLNSTQGLSYSGIQYSAGGTSATLKLELGDDKYDFIFKADESVAPSINESKPA